MVVVVSEGGSGINMMLITSRVLLSIVFPFIIFPLISPTSSRTVMRVRATASAVRAERKDDGEEEDVGEGEYLDFSDGWFIYYYRYLG